MRRNQLTIATLVFVALLALFWTLASRSVLAPAIGEAFAAVFVSFALILAVLLAFGFGLGEWLRGVLSTPPGQVLAAAFFVIPYLISAFATHGLQWRAVAGFLFIPVLLAGLFCVVRTRDAAGKTRLGWEDGIAFAVLALSIILHVFSDAWPYPGLSGLPKLLLTDVALYLYLVIRALPGVGYDLRPRARDLLVGAREWAFFAPIAIALGFALRFLDWHGGLPSLERVAGGLGFTFIFIAIPEEVFFRGLLLNLLQTRVGRAAALVFSAALFGLSHFNKGSAFNWRYVLLATIAGIFYGRAWRDRQRVFCAAVAHTLVDVTWSTWFR